MVNNIGRILKTDSVPYLINKSQLYDQLTIDDAFLYSGVFLELKNAFIAGL
jgi:hypothetical protein